MKEKPLKKYLFIFITFFSCFAYSQNYDFSKYTNLLSKEINKGNYPGFVTLIYKDNELIFSDTRGYKDLESQEPLRENSLFRIYSMSKPITGAALMILIEQGKARLTDPVEKFIPEFKSTKVLNKKGGLDDLQRPITLLDLATHSSGLTYSFVDRGKVKEIYDEENIYPYYFLDNVSLVRPATKSYPDVCTFSEKVASLPLVHQPGMRWTYSIGMDILGCVIERASGMSFSEFLKKNLFDPLEMDDTFFQVPTNKKSRMTDLYAHKKGFKEFGIDIPKNIKAYKNKLFLLDPKEDSFFFQAASIEDGGSGLVSTAADYMKFGKMLLNKGTYDGVQVMKEETVALMTKNHAENKAKPFSFSAFGMGVTVGVALDAKKLRMKRGNDSFFWGGAARTLFWVDPKNNLVFVHMSQVLGSPRLQNKIETSVYKALGF